MRTVLLTIPSAIEINGTRLRMPPRPVEIKITAGDVAFGIKPGTDAVKLLADKLGFAFSHFRSGHHQKVIGFDMTDKFVIIGDSPPKSLLEP